MAVIPNTNVNLATNVRDVLNAAGGSVTNDLRSFFKNAAKIDMWALFKPLVFFAPFTDNYPLWYKGIMDSADMNSSGAREAMSPESHTRR